MQQRRVSLADPLAPSATRLPQGTPRFAVQFSDDQPSEPGVRPFGLRFATTVAAPGNRMPAWRFDPERQIAVTPDGEPWYRSVSAMSMKTTGPSPDGGGSTGGEEFSPDAVDDAELPV